MIDAVPGRGEGEDRRQENAVSGASGRQVGPGREEEPATSRDDGTDGERERDTLTTHD